MGAFIVSCLGYRVFDEKAHMVQSLNKELDLHEKVTAGLAREIQLREEAITSNEKRKNELQVCQNLIRALSDIRLQRGDISSCVVCTDTNQSIANIPCGHVYACHACSVKCGAACLACGAVIESTLKIYI